MGRFYGVIGFAEQEETEPGIWTEKIVERSYYGDVIRTKFSWSSGTSINDNINIANEFTIIADSFAYSNIGEMRYLKWRDQCWKINSVDEEYPRLRLSIGGKYIGEQN